MTISGLDTERTIRRADSHDDEVPTPQRETLRETPAARLAAHVERQATSSDYATFLSNVANVANVAVEAQYGRIVILAALVVVVAGACSKA